MSETETDDRPALVRFGSRFTDRERALFSATATISLVAGYWFGLSSVPDAALDVPKTETPGHHGPAFEAAFQAMPPHAVVMTGIVLLVGGWLTVRALLRHFEEGSA